MSSPERAGTPESRRGEAPLVHYLTRHLAIACETGRKDLTGAPLNSTVPGMVTCPGCEAALAGTGGER